MDSEADHRRNRKRHRRSPPSPPPPPNSRRFSLRSVPLCFALFASVFLLSHQFSISSVAFRPVLVVSTLSRLSSSAVNSIQDFNSSHKLSLSLRIEDRVLFPDHVLLILSSKRGDWIRASDLDCVYHDLIRFFENQVVLKPVVSVDDYDEFRSIVRCPLPPENYSTAVNLRRRLNGADVANGDWLVERSKRVVHSWETVAYAAALDGDTVVVFVKGLNLRADRESDPSQFRCFFGFGNSERNGNRNGKKNRNRYMRNTKAIRAAQEVVRCSIPLSLRKHLDKIQGIRVSIGASHPRAQFHLPVPSVAKIMNPKSHQEKKIEEKYQLCVCSMVWNQASSLREWIVYHAWLGVERWFIYDNNSDDEIKEVIHELGEYNVSRHTWPWIKTQEAGFSHCALRARDECNWVAFMDVDEFFYFPVGKMGYPQKNSLGSLVTKFSSSSTTVAEIRTACHSFGPSGLSSIPSQGVMVGYTCRLKSPERHKSIVRPDALDATLMNVVHHFRLKKGLRYLNLPQSIAVINHYKYQVWEAFRAKFFRRVATYVADWQENQNEGSKDRAPGLGTEAIEPPNWPLQFCEIWDTGLRDFVLSNLADPSTGFLPWERYLL